jgi:hypothetical protein
MRPWWPAVRRASQEVDQRVVHAASCGHRVQALDVERGGQLAEHDDGADPRSGSKD